MSENLALWESFGKTDPDHTKKFQRAGGFRGTAVKPIYQIRKMTEQFGPCGKGWGMGAPSFQVVTAGDEIAVYCTVALWWEKPEQVVYGVGGDFVRKKFNNGNSFSDDEAFKKSFTDALSNAMKHLGMAADIHMGQHDDDKYVTALRREIAAENGTGSSAGSERRTPDAKAAGSSPAPSAKHAFELIDPTTGEIVGRYDRASLFLSALRDMMSDGQHDPVHVWGANGSLAKHIRDKQPKAKADVDALEQSVIGAAA